MIPLTHTRCAHTSEFLEHVIRVAEFYGFRPLDELPSGMVSGSRRLSRMDQSAISFIRREERTLVPVVRTCAQRGIGAHKAPAYFWRQGPPVKQSGARYATIELHVLGVPGGIAEALLIAVANALADEIGIHERVIGINSIGSEDSSARYERELSAYLRKHAQVIPPALIPHASADPISALVQLAEKKHPIAERAPQSMEFLNEEERQHLWEILEYLEAANVYYELNPMVLGSRHCWSHTLFEMQAIDQETRSLVPFVRGGRYDALTRRCEGGASCAAGLSIMCEIRGRHAIKRSQKAVPPVVYFAHLGAEAKRRSIPVLESLRRANIPVYQSLAHTLISDQMDDAKRLGVPYVLVMGHKEAVEGTVLFRDMRTNAQYEVPAPELPGYLRRRRIGA